jgi:Protein of unknown function (DUF4238)
MTDAHDHHYVPQFFLRNFSVDPAGKKITTVAKHRSRAVWATRSIEHLGYERDLYVHLQAGVPVSVESTINEHIENPISKSDTWAKIAGGRADALDRSDKPVLYALIRHLEARNPHYVATGLELAELAASDTNTIPFTDEEREMYAEMRARPDQTKAFFNAMSASLQWTERNYRGAGISILRSPVPLRSSTTPVLTLEAPSDPALRLPLPGMVPYQYILTLNKTDIVTLVLADFDDAFLNVEITADLAKGFNRRFVQQFAQFDHVRHLITDREDLADDMTWAPYDMVEETERKITFRRRA